MTEDYERREIDSQLKTELMTALQPAFAKISAMGVRYSEVPAHTMELADALNDVLSEKWAQLRGIEIVSFGVNSMKASEEDEKMIKDLQKSAVLRNPNMAAATLVGAQAEAMKAAASTQQAAPAQEAPAQTASASQTGDSWTCSCGAVNTGKFCVECGAKKPEENGWTCSCGTINKGKFCSNCGAKKPAGVPLYKCDKCGWEPEDPKNPPKFCPECGDPFDDNDIH